MQSVKAGFKFKTLADRLDSLHNLEEVQMLKEQSLQHSVVSKDINLQHMSSIGTNTDDSVQRSSSAYLRPHSQVQLWPGAAAFFQLLLLKPDPFAVPLDAI